MSHSSSLWPPTPPEISRAPQYAILAALDATLQLTYFALIAEHPEICDQDPEGPVLPARSPAAIASMICLAIPDVQSLIRHYRAAVDLANAEPPTSTDVSF